MALQEVLSPFMWGKGGAKLTPEQIAREREIAEALMKQGLDFSPVGHPLQGLARVANSAAGAFKNYRAGKAEEAGKSAFQDKWNAIAGSLIGGGSTGYGGGSIPSGSTEPIAATGDFAAKAPTVISRLSNDLGLTPEQAAGIVGQLGHESAGLQAINEKNPVVPGSRGGFGWAQWTGPRRKQFEAWAGENGLDVASDDANYGFLLHELQNTPEGGVLNAIRKAPDAQTAGRIFTDKFLRPGVPGYESRSKWTDRALAAYQAGQQPVQTASLDPTSGIAQALASPRAGDTQDLLDRRQNIAGPLTQTLPDNLSAYASPDAVTPLSGMSANEAMIAGSLAGAPLPAQTPGAPAPLADDAFNQRFAPAQAAAIPPSPPGTPLEPMAARDRLLSPQPMGGAPMAMVDQDPVSSIAASLTGANVDPDYPMAGGTMGQGGPGAFPAAPPAPQAGQFPPPPGQMQTAAQPSIAQLIELAGDPYAPEGTRQVIGALIQQQMKQADPATQLDLEYRRAQIADMQRKAANPNGEEKFFGNPVPIQNPDGSISYGQIGDRGTFRPIQLGEGQSFAPPTKVINTKTEQIIVDQAGNVISRTPIENREAAREDAAGAVEGRTAAERAAAAPADIQAGMNALDILDQIEKHPGLDSGTGIGSFGNVIPGTTGYDFQNIVEQAKSGAFLAAIQQMRGMGSLSNAEGEAATAAVTRMDTATSKEGFLAALRDYRKIVQQGIDRARGTTGEQPQAQPQPTQKRLRFNPATGALE